MSKNVRNFWIETKIDGRPMPMVGGPAAKDGEFEQTIYIRQLGEISTAVKIYGQFISDDVLQIDVDAADGVFVSRGADGRGFTVRVQR